MVPDKISKKEPNIICRMANVPKCLIEARVHIKEDFFNFMAKVMG